MGVSFRPDQMVKGGSLFEEGQTVFRNPRFKKHTYTKKGGTGLGQNPNGQVVAAGVTVFAVDLEFLGVNDAGQPELKREECIYSCGAGLEPSIDGVTVSPNGEGTQLVSPIGKKLVESTNWGEFVRRLFNVAPEVMDAVKFDGDVSVLANHAFYMKREKQPKRDIRDRGMINANPMLAQGAQQAPKKEEQGTYVMPVYYIQPQDLAWANGIPQTAGAPRPTAVVAPVVAPVAAPAAPNVVRMPAPLPVTGTPVATQSAHLAAPAVANPAATQVMLRAIVKAGGSMNESLATQAAFDVIKDEMKDLTPQRSDILKAIRTPGFLQSLPGVVVDNGLILGPTE